MPRLAQSAPDQTHTRPSSRAWLLLVLALGVLGVGWRVLDGGSEAALASPNWTEMNAVPGVSSFPEYSDRWRIGFGCARENGYVTEYDVSQLCAGWYHDWGVLRDPPRPDGIEYVQTIRVSSSHFDLDNPQSYGWTGLRDTILANPGSVWVIGNEPDGLAPGACDRRTPEEYAEVYHTFYQYIKGVDATAQVANGSIIQATPVRIQWLNYVWDAYQSQYGEDMPVDVWTMHNQIVKEAPSQGADIPLGCDEELGMDYGVQDNDNMTIFVDHVVRMRQWMKDHGQRTKPLYLTEYGVLQPVHEGFTQDRVNEFLNASFTYMMYATDSSLGMPADSNRLVQRWNWFALNVPIGRLGQEGAWNGTLFDPDTAEITEVGRNFARWACPEPHPTPTSTAIPLPAHVVREAEHGSTYGEMTRDEIQSASDCRYVYVPSGALNSEDPAVEYNVYIPDTGDYYVWGRGWGIDYDNRRFHINVDGMGWQDEYTRWYFGVGGWNWQRVTDDLGAPKAYSLNGRRWHSIEIGPIGGGLQRLDMVVVAPADYDPSSDSSIRQVCNPTPTATRTTTPTRTPSPTPTVTRTPMPSGPGKIGGGVTFQGRGNPPSSRWVTDLTVAVYLPGDSAPAYSFEVTCDNEGEFEVPTGILPGTYDVGVRNLHSLRNVRRSISISENTPYQAMGELVEGDTNNSKRVDILDFALLAGVYSARAGDPEFDERADLNDDGIINILDFTMLAGNYALEGDILLN